MMYQDENNGDCECDHHMGWSKENKIAMLEKKEKILEAKLDFIRKIKENMKKEIKDSK